MHINALAKEMEIPKAITPYSPGVFCALGCLAANFRRDFVQTVNRPLDDIRVQGINNILTGYAEIGKRELIDSGIPFTEILHHYELEMQYEGQLHTIRVFLDHLPSSIEGVLETYEKAYAQRFKDTLPEMKTRVVNLRCSTIGMRPKADLMIDPPHHVRLLKEAIKETRPVCFGHAFIDTPVYERTKIPVGDTIYGPAIIEQRDSVTVLEPDSKIHVDRYNNLVMEVQ